MTLEVKPYLEVEPYDMRNMSLLGQEKWKLQKFQ